MGISKVAMDKIKALYKAGYTCKEIAEALGLSETVILAVVNS